MPRIGCNAGTPGMGAPLIAFQQAEDDCDLLVSTAMLKMDEYETKMKGDLEDIPMAYLWYVVLAIMAIALVAMVSLILVIRLS